MPASPLPRQSSRSDATNARRFRHSLPARVRGAVPPCFNRAQRQSASTRLRVAPARQAQRGGYNNCEMASEKAAALIVVLAFVVLLTGLAVAYLSVATTDRQLAHSSFHDTDADLLARSALDIVIGDFKQEIVNGSTKSGTIYVPKDTGSGAAANMIPQRSSQIAAGVPNLIRRSVRSDLFSGNPAPPSRASAVNSQDNPSANNRSISSTSWNGHYLVPKGDTTTNDSSPIPAFTNATPDWIFVKAYDPVTQASPGPTVIPSPDPLVIGRYAYAVYDEGGLLDMNAAGYPSPTTILQYGRKGSLAFADLTGLPGFSTAQARDNIVGWRNYASSQPSVTPSPAPISFSFSANATNTYYNFIVSDPTNIQLTNYFTGSPLAYFTNSFLATSQAPAVDSRTDQALIARQELIDLRSAVSSGGISFSNALQSLGTFSREALANVPQWTGPSPPTAINPNFQTLLVTGSFTRNDGTTANVGDPYLNKRFLLQRLNWLTYRGPSAIRTIPASAPPLGDANYDMWLLTRGATLGDMNGIRFGLTSAFLQQGTAANILKYFGLVWQDATNQPDPAQRERWNYVGHSGGNSPASSIATLGGLKGTREPDFFELLQAGILNNSLGDGGVLSPDPALPSVHWSSSALHLHILAIGANLIAQSRADSYPVRIACTVSVAGTPTTMEAVGMPRLPCVSSLAVCPVGVTQTDVGGVNWFLIPNLWDPFRDTWDLAEANAGNAGNGPTLTPGYLRPPVRITVRGNTGFGYTNTIITQSGSVNPDASSVTIFPTASTGGSQSLVLAAGDSTFGRDGFREAMRLGTSDVTGSVTPFDPTTLGSSVPSWNRVVRPANDGSGYRNDDFVVFRISLSGTYIISGAVGKNPVLRALAGVQLSLDYQSPNGEWYPYSFLQGNNAMNTWISSDPVNPSNLSLTTTFSQYGQPEGYSAPTIVNSGTLIATQWTSATGGIAALAQAPMFAKADPRSIRYNSMIGVVNLAIPPMSFTSAGIIASIWPSPYATPAPMTPSAFPVPTPAGSPNPGLYSQLGDNSGDHGNPYSEAYGIAENSNPYRPVMMNRPFRSVGEMGYAFRDQPFRTLSFSSGTSIIPSPDAGLLDLFTTNDYNGPPGTPTPSPTPAMRAGVISLNSAQAPALASVLANTIRREDTPRTLDLATNPSPSPSPFTANDASYALTTFVSLTRTSPVRNKADLATLIANTNPVGFDATVPKTQRESIARAFGEAVQTRTWNLLVDLVAQTGHFKPNAGSLQNDFVVEGEQHYWVHVAIDRFTGRVVDKQTEVVKE